MGDTNNKLQGILDSLTALAEDELGYLVDPQSSSPVDWEKYPVMFIDNVAEEGNDGKIAGTLENILDISVAIMVKDVNRKARIKKITDVIEEFKQFIYRNYSWGCIAVTSEYLTSSTIFTTDNDSTGAALITFGVVYREKIP